ncbi:hypothetical protein RAD15_17590 [Bradyrhizobium sp. 14AA]
MKTDQALPAEIADAMETAGFSPKLATLMSIIKEFGKAKAEVKASPANVATAEPMWPLKGLLPLHVDYQKALRAIKSGQLDAVKLDGGGRWFCTERAMDDWLSKTGQGKR